MVNKWGNFDDAPRITTEQSVQWISAICLRHGMVYKCSWWDYMLQDYNCLFYLGFNTTEL